MGKTLGRYFQVRSPYYQATQYNQKTPTKTRQNIRTDIRKNVAVIVADSLLEVKDSII